MGGQRTHAGTNFGFPPAPPLTHLSYLSLFKLWEMVFFFLFLVTFCMIWLLGGGMIDSGEGGKEGVGWLVMIMIMGLIMILVLELGC